MTLWKSVERKIAVLLGGTREPVSGRQRGYKADIRHEYLSIEVKERQSLPAWLHEAMEQAEAAKQEGQHPIVVLHQKGLKHADDFVVMRLSEFTGWVQRMENEIESYIAEQAGEDY